MTDYISRKSFIERVKDIPFWGSVAVLIAEQLPAADVRPVVRGKWEPVMATRISWGEPKVVQAEEEWYGRMFKCSSCGTEMIGDPKYCYGCGAEMENGKDYGDD